MAHALYHARSSARKHGGKADDYLALHAWFDQTKLHVCDARHRVILHNSLGVALCEQVFGLTFRRASDGKEVPTREIACQHIVEDLGFIPSLAEALADTPVTERMFKIARALSRDKELQD